MLSLPTPSFIKQSFSKWLPLVTFSCPNSLKILCKFSFNARPKSRPSALPLLPDTENPSQFCSTSLKTYHALSAPVSIVCEVDLSLRNTRYLIMSSCNCLYFFFLLLNSKNGSIKSGKSATKEMLKAPYFSRSISFVLKWSEKYKSIITKQ